MSDNLWSVWLAAAVVLTVAELISLDLILIMLAAGAAMGMVTALIGAPVVLQVLAAGITSLVALTLLRPSIARRLHDGPTLEIGHTTLLGSQGTVTQTLGPGKAGQVKLGGELWSALPYDDATTLHEGDAVEVMTIRGATAYVHPVARLEP